jgi:hypothetical protein
VYIRAVDAAERLVGDPEGGALDGAISAWVVWSEAVEVKDLGVGKGRDVETHGLLGSPGEHQEGASVPSANSIDRSQRKDKRVTIPFATAATLSSPA